ncbi:MAG: molybdopterin-containing oxidoreductase family protein [Myxococcaceae bacterium]
MAINRRSLLQATGAIAGVAAAGVLPWPFRKLSGAEAAELTTYAGGTWVPSCCNMCGGQCGVLAYVENGAVRKVEPNGANPNNVANVSADFAAATAAGDIGRLCCKGNSPLRSLYDPDRLRTPLKRVGPRGSGQFVAITWGEAIAAAAAGLYRAKQRYGARSIVWFGEDHSFTHPQGELMDALGSPNYSNHANLCDTARKAHYKSTIGVERPLADLQNADFLLVFGWNFLSAIKWVHLPAIFTRGREKAGFKFVYVDPVFNTTASKADTWIAPKPGTDGALALALCKGIIDLGQYDTSFVAAYTLGFDEFKKYLDGTGYDAVAKTSAWASGITGIPAAAIDQLATELGAAYAANKKICIDAWSGPGHHTNATQGGRAINALNLLLGMVDKSGTMLVPLKSSPPKRAKPSGWPAKDGWRPDGRDDVTIPATNPDGTSNPVNGAVAKKFSHPHGSGIYVEMRERMLAQKDFVGNPYPISAAVFVFQNWLMSVPNTQRNIDAINKMEFVLAVDTHLSETAMMADIVVPGSHYLERNDFNANWTTFRSLGLRQKVVSSWIGGLTEAQFFLELGAALGLNGFKTDAGLNDTDDNYVREEWRLFMLNGTSPWDNQMTFDQLKQTGAWVESGARGGTQFEKHLGRPKSTRVRRFTRKSPAASTRLNGDTTWPKTAGTSASRTASPAAPARPRASRSTGCPSASGAGGWWCRRGRPEARPSPTAVTSAWRACTAPTRLASPPARPGATGRTTPRTRRFAPPWA